MSTIISQLIEHEDLRIHEAHLDPKRYEYDNFCGSDCVLCGFHCTHEDTQEMVDTRSIEEVWGSPMHIGNLSYYCSRCDENLYLDPQDEN
jgi:hypothetical protein